MNPGAASLAVAATLLLAGCSRPAPPAASQTPTPEPVKITQFYATAPQLARGEKELLCYGVEHAKTVWLSPPRQELTPSYTRCIEVTPGGTTTYTLTAEDGQGKSATQAVTVTVGPPKPPPVKIVEVTVTSLHIKPGDQVGICYLVENARAVTIAPAGYRGAGPKGCTVEHPSHTTTYVVSATGAAGDRDEQKVTVAVP